MRILLKCLATIGMVGAAAAAPARALTLDELKAELAKHPEAQWSAGDSGVVAQFAGKKNPFGLAAAYGLPERVANAAVFKTPAGLPAALDWRNKDGKNWLTPIRNQGKCGSCVAFGTVGALEGQMNISGNSPGFDADFSEQDLFSRIGGCESGSMPFEALMTLQSDGIPDEVCSPYISGRTGADVPTSSSCADVAQRAVKISAYASVSAADVKQALQNGPLLTTMTVYEDLMFYTGGVYKHVTGDVAGGHAIAIVGYDDAAGAFIVRNSWGTSWGEAGYFRIAYDDASGLGNESYSVAVTPDVNVKVVTPVHLQAVQGQLNMQAAQRGNTAFGAIHYNLTGQGVDGARDGTFDPSTLSASLNTADLADGVYVLRASAGTKGHDWFEMIEVANHPQQITVAVDADGWDATQPAKDRVYFKAHVTQQTVPLTNMWLQIEKTDGSVSKVQVYENPGTDISMGWRTKSFPNGQYKITALGKIGDLQQFQSNAMTVNVSN